MSLLNSNDRPEQINVPQDNSLATGLSAGIFAQAKVSDFKLPGSSSSASDYLHEVPMTITDSAAGQSGDIGTAATSERVRNPNTGEIIAQVDQEDGQIVNVKFQSGPLAGSQIVRSTNDGTYTLKDAQGQETPLTSVTFDEEKNISFTDTTGGYTTVSNDGITSQVK